MAVCPTMVYAAHNLYGASPPSDFRSTTLLAPPHTHSLAGHCDDNLHELQHPHPHPPPHTLYPGPPTHLRDMVISISTDGSPVLGSRESYLGAGSVAVKGSVG